MDQELAAGVTPERAAAELRTELASILSDRTRDVASSAKEIVQKIAANAESEVAFQDFPEVGYRRLSVITPDQRGILYGLSRTMSEELSADIGAIRRTLRDSRLGYDIFFMSPLGTEELKGRCARIFDRKL